LVTSVKRLRVFFSNQCRIVVYDKNDELTKKYSLDTLEEVVKEAHVVFLCVPTPMNSDGSCHTSIVESVIDDVKNVALRVSRDLNEFIVVVKSTVTPGFTETMRDQKGLRIVFSPEFLTEKNSIEDFENTTRVLVGGDEEDTLIVLKFFEKKLNGRALLGSVDRAMTLEMVKLYANTLLMRKVLLANEVYQVCDKLGLDYKEIMLLTCLDPRISRSHLEVPGPDGDFGAGGHCFPKDINNLRDVASKLETGERLFTTVIERNDELRSNKDWVEMKGRAVVEDYSKKTGD